jgi:hypothetical protein
MFLMAKIEKTDKIVRIIKKQQTVQFSNDRNWLLIDTDPSRFEPSFKWIPANTRFTWVKPFTMDII